jgi:hypothetical protein
MKSTTTDATIKALRPLFACFGTPRTVVSDNGPQLTSQEFAEFLKRNNIVHIKSSPYHPRTNGLAERAVRTFKDRLRAAGESCDINLELQRFLIAYRNTTLQSTGRSPAEMMFGHRLRTPLEILKPDVRSKLDNAATRAKINHDPHTTTREFLPSELVWYWDTKASKYEPGIIKAKTGIWSYKVQINGKIQRCHADQLRKRYLTTVPKSPVLDEQLDLDDEDSHDIDTPIAIPQIVPTSISKETNTVSLANTESVPLVNVEQSITSTPLSIEKVGMLESSILPTTTNTQLRRSERGLIPLKPKPYDRYLQDITEK